MSRFKVGDRVAVYDSSHGRRTGEIIEVTKNTVGVKPDGFPRKVYWPEQCRRLKKPERRRVWISEASLQAVFKSHFEDIKVCVGDERVLKTDVEFIEVRRPKQ